MGQFAAYGQGIYLEEKEYNIFFFWGGGETIHPLSYEVIRYFFSPPIPRFLPTFLFHSSLRLEDHPTEFLFSSRVIFLSFILSVSFHRLKGR